MAMCYRDREFCNAGCATQDCSRNLTPAVQADADRWFRSWARPDDDRGAPISQRDMSAACPDYQPIEEKSLAV